jgi:cyanophycin synthetase
VDLVCEDISRPLAEQRGAIVEVNAGPGLLMHIKPAEGEPRPVGRRYRRSPVPRRRRDGRIPVVGVTGTNGKTVAALWRDLLQLSGKHTGLACSDGLFLDRRQWRGAATRQLGRRPPPADEPRSGSRRVRERQRHDPVAGPAYDRCQVGVVTNFGKPDHIGDFYVEDADRMYNVLHPGGCGAADRAVLNAADARLVEMAELCDGDVIFFGLSADLPAIATHRAAGKRAVFVRDGKVVLATGNSETGAGPMCRRFR